MIACDLGSNTIRFVEIDCKTKKRVKEFEKIVKSADGLSQSGKISKDAIKRVVDAINEAKEIFDFSKGVEAVTTEAVRVAKNQKEVLDEIYTKTGIKFKVLSGEEEAFFTNYAVKEQVVTKSYILLDIGGGSTEISIVNGDDIYSQSFALGIVTLTQMCGLQNLRVCLEKKLKEIEKIFKSLDIPKQCVATAGTPTTIAAFLKGMDYKNYDYTKINGTILTFVDIQRAKDELLKLDFDERKRWVGVGREDLIISGIEILLALMNLFSFESITVIDDGLREGVALFMCKKN